MKRALLQVNGLTVAVGEKSKQKILDRVSFVVPRESIVALVGGSGSGKTTAGLSIMRLLPSALVCTSGQALYDGVDLLSVAPEKVRSLRGKDIAMVFQDPLQAFNPVFTVGAQVSEIFQAHTDLPKDMIKDKVLEKFSQVGLDDPLRIFRSYPHQLSGGMRQRAMIAQAMAASPSLLIADEPTSSLDVTLQAKILELFTQLKDTLRLSIILITHDLGVVKHAADYVVVMSQGRVVESGPVREILSNPKHSYTQQLMGALND